MAERKGKSHGNFLRYIANSLNSVEQILSPGLRSVNYPSPQATEELATSGSSHGTILYVRQRLFISAPTSYTLLFRRCNTCGEYIYKGKKFNARKETVEGEDYYGIKIFRFYIKWCVRRILFCSYPCLSILSTLCSAEITFKTDPKNTDYAAEHGASRNFEPWREEAATEEVDRLAKLEEEENNPMKKLENRTMDSKREMDILDALQDIRARNARNERVGQAIDLLDKIEVDEEVTEEDLQRRVEDEEDEKLVRHYFSKVDLPGQSSSSTVDGSVARPQMTVKRKADGAEPDIHSLLPDSARALISSKTTSLPMAKKKKTDGKNTLGIKVVKGKGKTTVA
jgi:hypothetical protein